MCKIMITTLLRWFEIIQSSSYLGLLGMSKVYMLLNVKVIADWKAIRMRIKQDIDKNNNREKCLCVNRFKKVGDKVLIIDKDSHLKMKYIPPKVHTLVYKFTQIVE